MMTTSAACPAIERLKALSSGRLDEQESDDVAAHIETCAVCRAEMDTIEDREDSVMASLRGPDEHAAFDDEADCRIAVAKALGALALAREDEPTSNVTRIPAAIAEYEIVRPLGQGGMGSVYLARHTRLGREVALKVLSSHRLTQPKYRERFDGEIRAIGRLKHPNIVTAHDARETDGVAVLVTEFIPGLDLGELVRRVGPLSVADASEIGRQVAVALEYTRSQGFVHRDIKPSNIMLSDEGEVKLLDLGLARLHFADDPDNGLTGTGQTIGTADYIAPEQVTDSRSVDIRADVYSLGCTLMKLLTGKAPFADDEHKTVFAKLTAHVSSAPPPLDRLLPGAASLGSLVDSMLAKSPEQRPETPGEVARRLAELASGADLRKLSRTAREAAGTTATPADTANTARVMTGTVPRKPFWHRRIPLAGAVALSCFCLLIGFSLGIVIRIKYPDGTVAQIHVPPLSEVSIESTGKSVPGPGGGSPMPIPGQSGKLFRGIVPAEPAGPDRREDALSIAHLKQLAIAFHDFHSSYQKFPGSVNRLEGARRDREHVEPFSWRVAILPFIEHQELFQQYRFHELWDSDHNRELLEKMPAIYRSPFAAPDQPPGETNYLGFAGADTALGTNGGIAIREIRDGTSNTLLLLESKKSVPWTKPEDIEFQSGQPLPEGVFFENLPLRYLRVDGSVHTMRQIDEALLGKLITHSGGELILE